MYNLVLIHLESLNQMIYRMNPELFPNLRRIAAQSYGCQKFFSSATSTVMVLADIMYGSADQYEKNQGVIAEQYDESIQSSLFDDLYQKDFFTKTYSYPLGVDMRDACARKYCGFYTKHDICDNMQEFVAALQKDIEYHKHFAILCASFFSNIAYGPRMENGKYQSGGECWRIGYKMLDDMVGEIFRVLKDTEHLSDTLVVLYGDHGDTFWGKGFHSGLTHAIEPYAELVHTPLWIWNNGLCTGEDYRLISAVDMRGLISRMLVDNKTDVAQLMQKRENVFFRSAFSGQPLRLDSFNKSYGISDGQYLLIVSGKGLEMYDILIDPGCSCNILEWFILKDNILVYAEEKFEVPLHHYGAFMNMKQKRILRQKFYHLKKNLYEYTLERYHAGDKDENNLQNEMKFCFIRTNYL